MLATKAVVVLTSVLIFVSQVCGQSMPDCGDYLPDYMGLRVLDADTHMPVVGAEVIVRAYDDSDRYENSYNSAERSCRAASDRAPTDNDGDAIVKIGCPGHDNVCGSRKSVTVRAQGYRFLEFTYILEGTWDSVGGADRGQVIGPMTLLSMRLIRDSDEAKKWGISEREFFGFVGQVELKALHGHRNSGGR